jgi:hypothetical protein
MEPSQRNPLVGHVVRVSGKSAENIRVDRAELVFNCSLQCASLGPPPLNSECCPGKALFVSFLFFCSICIVTCYNFLVSSFGVHLFLVLAHAATSCY